MVTKVDRVGTAAGTEVGAKRVLNDAFHETLVSLDDDARSFSCTIDDGPGPVAKDAIQRYVGSVRVLPVTDRDASFVEWQSNYEANDDAAVGAFCNPIYQAALGALKRSFT
ncbi:MAG TPA: SRPBCC family protein [Thermoanaerobaculia bacterium]|nr:SRPBCC family protein [Thermoanaerobaculia bacterium]